MSLTEGSIIRSFKSLENYLQSDQTTRKLQKVQRIIKLRRQNQRRKKIKFETGEVQIKSTQKLQEFCKDQVDHKVPLEQLYRKYQTDPVKGLTEQEAEKRLNVQGLNEITDKDQPHWTLLFLKQMSDPFNLFIWFLVVMSFIGYGINPNDSNTLMLALLLIVTIVSGAMVSYSFNRQSQGAISSLKQFLPQFSSVVRNQKIQDVKTQTLVRGDIVMIQAGQKIPADIRVIESRGMKVNKSSFTGQSILIKVQIDDSSAQNMLNSKNMLFSGTINQQGSGKGIVLQTGNTTLVSKLAEQILDEKPKSTILQRETARYVLIMIGWAFTVGTLVFTIGWANGFVPLIAMMIAIGVLIASVPGALNLILIVIKTISVKNLAKNNMIAKSLHTVDPFGAVSVICTDKTGTLTLNKMAVSSIYYNGRTYKGENMQIFGKNHAYEYNVQDTTFKQLHKCAILTSAARFNKAAPRSQLLYIGSNRTLSTAQKDVKQKQLKKNYQKQVDNMKYVEKPVLGDPQQTALLRFFQPIQDVQDMKQKYPILRNQKSKFELALPFSSQRKYSIAIVKDQEQSDDLKVYTKGAPQTIFNFCSSVLVNGNAIPKNDTLINQFNLKVTQFSKKGQRILALSMKTLPKSKHNYQLTLDPPNFSLYNQTFLGIISLNDPPKRNVDQLITKLKTAGIKVIMLTGDSVETATTIARQCNIFTSPKTVNEYMKQRNMQLGQAINFSRSIVVHGEQLMRMNIQDEGLVGSLSGRKLDKILQMEQIVFARISPYQKYQIVEALQKQGHIVAVTGDGVNDAPAIKLADIGICMGSGANATRESADIIVTDDNIYNIIKGIYQGRVMFQNMKKCICYVMTSQVQQFVPFLCLLTFRVPIPIFTLLVDAAVDFFPSVAFAFEQGQLGIMTRKPRFTQQHLVGYKLLIQCSGWMGLSQFLACFCCYFLCMNDFGFELGYLWGKSNIPILVPLRSDSYNPSDKFFGNSNLANIKTCEQFLSKTESLDWINATRPWADLRMSLFVCKSNPDGTIYFEPNMVYSQCKVQQISIYSGRPVCYTTQATKYGQTSYMMGNVVCQIFNMFICKTRRDSVFTHGIQNRFFYFSIALQYLLTIALTQTIFMINLISTRDILFVHFGLPAIPIGMIQLFLDQLRKYLIRNLPRDNRGDKNRTYEDSIPNWWEKNTLW